jgi:hypothetical protein
MTGLWVDDDAGVSTASAGVDVIAYRGAKVGSRDAWIADAKSRGGVITRVPNGFFAGMEAARFGAIGNSARFFYELPPAWLVAVFGFSNALDQFQRMDYELNVREDNQLQDIAAIGDAAINVVQGATKLLPLAIYAVAALAAMYLVVRLARLVK